MKRSLYDWNFKKNNSLLGPNENGSLSNSLSQKIHSAAFSLGALLCALWGVGAAFVNYFFASFDLLKLTNVKIPILNGSGLILKDVWYHTIILCLVFFSLIASLLTLALVSGNAIYTRIKYFNLKDIKEYLRKEMTWVGGIGLFASIICTITYMLWSLFSASCIFHSKILIYFLMIGTGLSMLCFITPSVVKVLNNLCNWRKKNYSLNKKLLFFAGFGEISIFPILFFSCKEDLQTHFRLSKKLSLYISLAIIGISAILMIIATQEDGINEKKSSKTKQKTTRFCIYKIFGVFILSCTGITGGTFSTYVGLCKLGWFSNTVSGIAIKLLWGLAAAFYWIAFYRGVLKKVCDDNHHCKAFRPFSFFKQPKITNKKIMPKISPILL